MFTNVLLLSQTHASDTWAIQNSQKEFQLECMKRFLKLDTYANPVDELQRADVLDNTVSVDNLCAWNGVKCFKGVIVALNWPHGARGVRFVNGMTASALALRWLPSSLKRITLERKHTDGEMSTRSLPKAAERIAIVDCLLRGSIDMTTLPAGLVGLDVSSNNLGGGINLLHLPLGLRLIDMRLNMIKTAIVANARLPKDLQRITLQEPVTRKMYRVNVICVDDKTVDTRVF